MGEVTTVGLDVAKHVFQVHGIDDQGTVVIRRKVRRSELLKFFRSIQPCVVVPLLGGGTGIDNRLNCAIAASNRGADAIPMTIWWS